MIRAEVYADNDDDGPLVEFDATPWFQQASDKEILELRSEDYGFGYASDCGAEFVAERNRTVSRFFTYLDFRQTYSRGRACGYSVRVGDRDAEAWIAENRPHLAIAKATPYATT